MTYLHTHLYEVEPIYLLAQAMAMADMPMPPICLQADALVWGMRHVLAVLQDLQGLVVAIGTRQSDVGAEKLLQDHWVATETALAAMARQAGVCVVQILPRLRIV